MSEKLCYNKGCGVNFKEEDNKNDSCRHHPGHPVFHDTYKIWSCCDKKSTCFTEFLDIKGCTVGLHNPEKPKEPEKPKQEIIDVPVVQEVRKPAKTMERPSDKQTMVRLTHKVGASLKPILEKLKEQGDAPREREIEVGIVPTGTPCKNYGCKLTYQGDYSNREDCAHHNGAPIFHEGMKYWSCCQRKSSDFDSFYEQEGCTIGRHCWFKQVSAENLVACRHDWHQTGSEVVISVFAKASFPDRSYIELNPVKCHIYIVFGAERAIFDKTIVLGGVVNVSSSSVEYFGSKVEIKLKKAEPVSWKDLAIKEQAPKKVTEDLENITLDDVEALVNHDIVEEAREKFFKYNDST